MGGGVFVSSPAYADGYVAPDGNIYYGYKSDADYSKNRIKIEVHYYSNKDDADKDNTDNQDPLGKFVHVKYVANLNSADNSFDRWAFRPMWWYGVPAGLTNVQNINYSRFEKYTDYGTPADTSTPGSSAPGIRKDSDNVTKHYKDANDWKSISRFYVEDPSKLKSMNGLAMLLGVDGGKNKGYDPNGTNAGNWKDFYDASKGMQGMFIDWESAGKRFYEMTYVAELTDDAWKNRDEHPLRFAAGVYRFAGNWHIATGQIHRAPKIADSLKVQYPPLTPVAKADDLKDNEKTSVENAIKTANKDVKHFNDLLEKIEVANDGTATLTFHDKTTITMPGKLLVVEDKKDNVKFPPVYPAPIGVVKPKSLSDADQKAIIQGFKKANADKDFLNKVSKTDSEAYKFDNTKQELTITYTDGSTITVPYSSLVYQGATIADWAPYRIPVPTEVDDPSQALTEEQKTAIASAFDEANKSFPVYQAAKTHNNNTSPVTFDNKNNAVITWADGSQTTVPAWMFLKKKQTQATKPEQKQTTKEFTVYLPATPTEVTFDPFDKTATVGQDQLTNLEASLQALTAKDASDSNKTVTLTSAKIDIATGTVTFKAKGYEDRKYPIGIFYKKKVNGTGTQNPTQQTPTSKTDTDPNNNKNTYKYFVTKTQISESKVSDVKPQEAAKALKQFVKDNYTGWTEQELENVTSNVAVGTSWKAKTGTTNLEPYNKGNGRITSISVNSDNGLTVTGYQYADQEDDNIDASTDAPLFIVSADDLYAPNSGSQTPIDNTINQLKALAKQLLDEKKNLTKSDFTRAGLDKDKITNDVIDNMTDAEDLRDLIKKLSEAKHADRTYNSIGEVVVDDPTKLTEDDFKKAVKAFVKANYDKSDNFQVNDVTTALPTDLTPKSGTIDMEIADDNIKSVTSSETDGKKDYKSIVFKDAKGTQLFTVAISYKKKEETPKLSDDELKEMRKQAKETIDHNPNLTKTDKDGFDKRIDEATTAEQIQNILKEAAEKANQNSTSTDPKIKGEISGNQNGTDAENQQKLDAAKDAAEKAIDALKNLSNEEKTEFKNKLNGTDIKTPADVQQIVDAAKLADELKGVKDGAQKEKFVFLDHGTGDDKHNAASTHTEDAALNSVLDSTPEEDSTLKTLAEKLKEGSKATAADIRAALDAAKRANDVNEQAAKRAATAKLDALEQSLNDAYNKLSETDKTAVSTQYNAAKDAITKAKGEVTTATKPSDLLNAINSVNTSLNAANKAVNDKIDTEHNNNKKNNDHSSDPKALQQEKDKAKKDIDGIPGLTEDEKNDYKKQIDDSTHSGDPEAVVNRAKKNDKIKKALEKIKDFTHLNNAQRDAFKRIIEDTDAHNHTDADGKDLGIDDIDVALANAANTDNAMARLEDLKKKANDFKNEKDGKYSKLTNSEDDQNKKKAFDSYLDDATKLTTPKDGDAKGAAEVNTLYNDLLKAMRDIDPQAKSAGLKTAALKAEIDSDNKLKPNDNADPKTPGDSVYTTASADKKDAFDKALNEAQTVLNGADTADISDADKEATEQNEIDAALDKLIKARLALDGVNTKPLQDEIDNAPTVKGNVSYTKASADKKKAYDDALEAAQKLIAQLTGKDTQQGGQGAQQSELKTKEQKQQALDAALKALRDAAAALDGKESTPVPPSDDDNTGSGSESDSGSSSDSGSGTSTSTSGGVNKQNLINQINTTENPGGANPGSGAAGTNPSTPGAGAQGAGMGAVTPGSGSGAAGTGAAGAANAGVDNKAVNNAVENAPEVKQADAAVKQAAATLDEALAQAKRVAADPHATQAQVDAAAAKLADARKALADAQANAAKVRAAVRSRVIKGIRSRGNAGIATGADVATTGLMATMIAAIGGAFATRRMRTKHANRD